MKRIGVLTSLLLPSLALAGGDYVSGTVSDFSGKDGIYSFTFVAEQPLSASNNVNRCESVSSTDTYLGIHGFRSLTRATRRRHRQSRQRPCFKPLTELCSLFCLAISATGSCRQARHARSSARALQSRVIEGASLYCHIMIKRESPLTIRSSGRSATGAAVRER